MTTKLQQAIVDEVFAALEANQLELPTLPDIAIKIRDLIDDPNVSADQLVNLLSADPVISAHIIKAANSAAFSRGKTVDNLRDAVSRLGYRMLRNLVMTITMSKLFQGKSPVVNQQLMKLWEHSREVAATSYVLALHQKHLKPEQAMLAGLMHDIGALPLYLYADRHHPHLSQPELEELIRKFHGESGAMLLQNWNFPKELVDVVSEHENLQRTTDSGAADYVDVVTVADMQMSGMAKFVAWENVHAAARLGYSAADCQNFLSNHVAQLAVVQGMLGINATQPEKPPQPTIAAGPKHPPAPEHTESGLLSSLSRFFK